jgi:hypothetical protein
MKAPVYPALFLVLATVGAIPVLGAGKTDQLAACMWEKMPTTSAAFVEESDGSKGFSLFLKAAADCDPVGNVNLSSLRKKLAAIRPVNIGPDSISETNAYVCPRSSDGTVQPCKPAGE